MEGILRIDEAPTRRRSNSKSGCWNLHSEAFGPMLDAVALEHPLARAICMRSEIFIRFGYAIYVYVNNSEK
jgi:hypothetical protein